MHVRDIDPRGDDGEASELHALQRTAYAVEAALLGDDRIPPLWETVEELRRARLSWVGALRGERLVGAVAWSVDEDVLDVARLVVSPEVHRCGIGSALVRSALTHAGGRPTVVSTGRGNRPARALYERLGFAAAGEVEVVPGLWVSRYRRQGTN